MAATISADATQALWSNWMQYVSMDLSGFQNGNLLILFVGGRSTLNNSWSAPSGTYTGTWTMLPGFPLTAEYSGVTTITTGQYVEDWEHYVAAWWKIKVSGDATVNFNDNETWTKTIYIGSWSGVDPTTPYTSTALKLDANWDNIISNPAITTTKANQWIVLLQTSRYGSPYTVATYPSGYTSRPIGTANTVEMQVADSGPLSAGTYTPSDWIFTSGQANKGSVYALALNPSGATTSIVPQCYIHYAGMAV